MPETQMAKRLEPRKKPGQLRSAETVGAVLEAAARILEEGGFAGYTTNAVAERAGVSIGSLYQYFPGKDAITVALIERETATLLDEIAAAGEAESFDAGLRGMVASAVRHQMRRPALARLLDFEEARLPIGPRNARVADRIHAILISLLKRSGTDMGDDVDVLAFDVLAIVKGMVDVAGERGETDAATLERRVSRAVFGYLGLAK
jgi:AcrR family transcriptional regulator